MTAANKSACNTSLIYKVASQNFFFFFFAAIDGSNHI